MTVAGGATHASYLRSLRTVLRSRGYRRLLGTRLVSQGADGAFQVGLASLIFFSPERQATTAAVAWAFSASLLPYTLVGPFAGVLLDRWHRRQVLLVANLVRAVIVAGAAVLVAAGVVGPLLYVTVLACLSINRFFLSGLSASLPHVVPRDQLVMANAVTPTLGTSAVVLGGGVGYALRNVLGVGDTSDALVLTLAAGAYLASAAVVSTLARDQLGPDGDRDTASVRHQVRSVVTGMWGGVRHVRERRPALWALALIGVHRIGYGLLTIAAVLLCRSYLSDPQDVDAGLALVALVLGVTGAGFGVGAVVTPWAVARIGLVSWVLACLVAAAATQSAFVVTVRLPVLLVGVFLLGVTAQGIKVSVDSVVQTSVDDAYRGRVFSFYDVVFNAAFIVAALVAVVVIPPDGYSRVLFAGVGLLYLVAAVVYRAESRRRPCPPQTVRVLRPTDHF